jgi:flagellar hook-basal body complex protein FliE
MDGLTISNAETMLERGSTLRQLRESSHPAPVVSPPGASAPGEKSFADTLKDAVQSVNQSQKVADQKMQELATGRAESISDVMISAEKADIALKLMVQVRNKIIEAYQEIMKMQV